MITAIPLSKNYGKELGIRMLKSYLRENVGTTAIAILTLATKTNETEQKKDTRRAFDTRMLKLRNQKQVDQKNPLISNRMRQLIEECRDRHNQHMIVLHVLYVSPRMELFTKLNMILLVKPYGIVLA